jgi:uncharacterized protein (DUF1697 family)
MNGASFVTYIALFRGINVGGSHLPPMKELKLLLEENGCVEVETYIHLFFLAGPPKKADVKSIEALKARTERFALKGRIFYLHTPDGFGASKLAQRAERLLGVQATARNWRTVTTLLEMVKTPSLAPAYLAAADNAS